MDKIWIVNRYLTRNLGDRLLGKGLEDILSKRGFKIQRLEYTGNPSGWLKSICKLLEVINLEGLACAASCLSYLTKIVKEKPSVVFVGGGQLLFPNKTFLSALFSWSIFSKLFGFKLILFSVGTENFNGDFPPFKRLLLKFSLNQADEVRLRDYHSQELIKGMFGNVYPVVPDTAYGLNLENWKFLGKKDVYICPLEMRSVSVCNKFRSREEYFNSIFSIANKYIKKSDQVFLFSSVKDDYDEINKLSNYMSKKIENKISTIHIENEDSLLRNLGRARVVISARMHPLIFAHILGAKPVAVNVCNKIKSFSESYLSSSPEKLKKELFFSIDKLNNA